MPRQHIGLAKVHQEQVPRKQGLKPSEKEGAVVKNIKRKEHQEQVPRKQGLKRP